ncbi:MAG: DNA repair protein RecO [Blastochloris sp.]|nr:DNA repair protein RecO [Blastochloris sp.]
MASDSVRGTYEDEGVLVHQSPYSESSRITVWLTRQHGILRTLVKGLHRKGNNAFGVLDLFYQCQISYSLRPKSTLHQLTQSLCLKTHQPGLLDYHKQLAALYCFEVIDVLVEKQTPIPDYYELYLQALGYLETHPASWLLIERFERRALTLAGLNEPARPLPALRRSAYPHSPKSFQALEKALPRS